MTGNENTKGGQVIIPYPKKYVASFANRHFDDVFIARLFS